MKSILTVLLISILALTITSCNKEKRYSNKLIKGEQWTVKDITVAESSLNTFGTWKVMQDVNIYDTVPQVLWIDGEENSIFEWQFQNKGKVFQLNYMQLCEECDGEDLSTLDHLTYDLTGTYNVERHGRKKMEFSSDKTIKYSGETVSILIEKQ
jgi:hypothetical protein